MPSRLGRPGLKVEDQGLKVEDQGLKVGSDFKSLVFQYVQIKSLGFHFNSLVFQQLQLSLPARSN